MLFGTGTRLEARPAGLEEHVRRRVVEVEEKPLLLLLLRKAMEPAERARGREREDVSTILTDLFFVSS